MLLKALTDKINFHLLGLCWLPGTKLNTTETLPSSARFSQVAFGVYHPFYIPGPRDAERTSGAPKVPMPVVAMVGWSSDPTLSLGSGQGDSRKPRGWGEDTSPYIRVTVAHGLAEIRIHTTSVSMFNLRLGAHLWRRDMLHTHIHKA